MPKIKDPWLIIEWRAGSAAVAESDPSDFLYKTSGKIFALTDAGNKVLVGRFKLYYVDVEAAWDANESVFDVFDTSSATAIYYEAIYDLDTREEKAELIDLLGGEIHRGNVLILDRLEILPRFRRRGLGLVVMRSLIRRFGAGAGLVAIKPFPLQFEKCEEDEWRAKLEIGQLDRHYRRATATLKRYYGKLGFIALKGSPFMFMSTAFSLPKTDALRA